MQPLLLAFDFVQLNPEFVATTLVSATCIGNDGTSCPLFHGSLAPKMFSRKPLNDYWKAHACCPALTELLSLSNNITWVQHLQLRSGKQHAVVIVNRLKSTRYASRSIRTVELNSETLPYCDALLKKCTALESIYFDGKSEQRPAILQDMVIHLSEFRCVTILDLWGCTSLTDTMLQPILRNSAKKLKYLGVRNCANITDASLSNFFELRELESLNAGGLRHLTGNCFEHLTPDSNPKMKSLILENCNSFTDSGLTSVCENLLSVELLNLENCLHLTVNGLQHLGKLTKMKCLSLQTPGLTDECLTAFIPSLIHLEFLYLTNAQRITDNGVQPTSALMKLKEITITHAAITNTSLQFLSTLPNLRFIDISGCVNVSDAGLARSRI
jgi:hypothetical protein